MMLTLQARWTRGAFTLDVNTAWPMEGVTALFGRSGCGKTTLLRMLAGLERVRGAVVHSGETVWQEGATFVPPHRRRVGVVFQEASLLAHLSVRANLAYGWRRTPVGERRFGVDEVAAWLGLTDLLDHRPDQLSGGQTRRVALGRAMLTSPKLLLLDEPLSGLDRQSRREIMPDLIKAVRRTGLPVVLVSHQADEVEYLADRVAFMHQGGVERVETLSAALARPDSPLFDDDGPVSVLTGRLVESSEQGLVRFECGSVGLWVPRTSAPACADGRLRILARDVTLALDDPQRISVLNRLPVVVETMHAGGDGDSLLVCRLENGQALLAQITTHSLLRLGISGGQRAYALIKSLSLHPPM